MTPRCPLPADPQDRYDELSRRFSAALGSVGPGMSDRVCGEVRDLVRDLLRASALAAAGDTRPAMLGRPFADDVLAYRDAAVRLMAKLPVRYLDELYDSPAKPSARDAA